MGGSWLAVAWWIFLGGCAAVFLLLIWGVAIEPRLLTEARETVRLPALPSAWQGQRVALIADLQIGMWLENVGAVRRAVARLIELRPAAVFLAGDFVYHASQGAESPRENSAEPAQLPAVRELGDLLRPLQAAGLTVYAVLGNHDYALKSADVPAASSLAARVRQELEKVGVRVLQNEAIQLGPPGSADPTVSSGLWLVGIGPHLVARDRAHAALAQVPPGAARLVLMHNPDSFPQLPAGSAPLAMCGHTHGGQVRFPWLLLRRLLGRVNRERPELSGWIHDYGEAGNRLYITRGIGFSRLPLRINASPELTLFTLQAAEAGEAKP